MKPFIFIYCEGNEIKALLAENDKSGLKIHKVISASSGYSAESVAPAPSDMSGGEDFNIEELSGDISFDEVGAGGSADSADQDSSDIAVLAAELDDVKLNQAEFIPISGEPQLGYHIFSSAAAERKKLLAETKSEIFESKGVSLSNDLFDYIPLNENNYLAAYLEGENNCINTVYKLATYNGKRYYKIPTIKSADLSLIYFVSKTNKFFPEDNTLIIYIGKDYSKLLFIEGQTLQHIGSTLDIGTKNLHTYDVYFSKILLEMENGGIQRLDNIIICGEDRSENLVLSFYGTFPEANVTQLSFDSVDTGLLSEEEREEISSFSIPIAAAVDYFDDLNKVHRGIQILPKYIIEQQKFLQFGWHSYAVFPFLFGVAFYFTFTILSNYKDINDIDRKIEMLNKLKIENQSLVNQINPLAEKVSNFDNIQTTLDSISLGSEFWSRNLDELASFAERRRNFWASRIELVQDSIQIEGYSLSRKVLTKLADENSPSILRNIYYEPLREKNAYKYLLNILYPDRLEKNHRQNSELIKNEP